MLSALLLAASLSGQCANGRCPVPTRYAPTGKQVLQVDAIPDGRVWLDAADGRRVYGWRRRDGWIGYYEHEQPKPVMPITKPPQPAVPKRRIPPKSQ